MGLLFNFLVVYILGGLTFLPLLVLGLFVHAYLTFPVREDIGTKSNSILQPGDDSDAIKDVQRSLEEKGRLPSSHGSEVAAGYFAVCREYVPGGVNGKPPERNSPVGSMTVSTPSPSVYQSMYRSIFERKQNNNPLNDMGAGKPQKRGSNNVFYVVLRHGHLMLFDDEELLEVRYVISLHHHDVSLYSGGDEIPEGELFIKRNAVCLSRKTDIGDMAADNKTSKPFFLFSENCSDKEDFYFALLRNQERIPEAKNNPPTSLRYDVKDIITLVQRLHSSEEHLQTRWINALIGRIFLALYKTPEVENFIRAKITKKISRVKTPAFLSKIVLRHIDMGEAAPVITNPRLKDLTVDGELTVEADVRYAGNFRIEVATTARIELGSRFKAREVNLLLAVVLKRIVGHMFVRIKPPPSNRVWVTFQSMPKIDMSIEPIVSSRQITYTLILRQIENRIKEVIAESLVSPNWDDSPFYYSESKLWRGGIWAEDSSAEQSLDHEAAAVAKEEDIEEAETLEAEHAESLIALPHVEKSISMPLINVPPTNTPHSRKGAKALDQTTSKSGASSTSVDSRSNIIEKPPRVLRSGSFASSPIVSTDVTNVDAFKSSLPDQSQAASAMAAISALSQTNSPLDSPSPSLPPRVEKPSNRSSRSSSESDEQVNKEMPRTATPEPSANPGDSAATPKSEINAPSPASLKSEPASIEGSTPSVPDPRRQKSTSSGKSGNSDTKKLSLAAVTNAAANAKKWGWNALQRHGDQRTESSSEAETPSQPIVIGRGKPLPPPGMPLPGPDRKTKTAPMPVPKRKPIPMQKTTETNGSQDHQQHLPPPPLPKRRGSSRRHEEHDGDSVEDSVLVVSVPHDDSKSSSPSEQTESHLSSWPEGVDKDGSSRTAIGSSGTGGDADAEPPRLANRRPPHRILSSSPEEDGQELPSWLAAQEEEARVKNSLLDEDMGV